VYLNCKTIIYKDGNLEKVIKKMIESKKSFSEERVFDFIFYLTDALKFLHEKKIIHKEIKPK
jgi:serine/threonine protein kinase